MTERVFDMTEKAVGASYEYTMKAIDVTVDGTRKMVDVTGKAVRANVQLSPSLASRRHLLCILSGFYAPFRSAPRRPLCGRPTRVPGLTLPLRLLHRLCTFPLLSFSNRASSTASWEGAPALHPRTPAGPKLRPCLCLSSSPRPIALDSRAPSILLTTAGRLPTHPAASRTSSTRSRKRAASSCSSPSTRRGAHSTNALPLGSPLSRSAPQRSPTHPATPPHPAPPHPSPPPPQTWNGSGNGSAEVLGSVEEAWAITGRALTAQQLSAQRADEAVLSLLARLSAQQEGWRNLSQESAALPALVGEVAALRAAAEGCIAQAEALSARLVEVRENLNLRVCLYGGPLSACAPAAAGPASGVTAPVRAGEQQL